MVDTGLAGPAIHGCYIRSYDPLGQSLLGERQALRELVGVPVIHFRLWQISPPRPTLRQGPGCSESPTTSPQDLNKNIPTQRKEVLQKRSVDVSPAMGEFYDGWALSEARNGRDGAGDASAVVVAQLLRHQPPESKAVCEYLLLLLCSTASGCGSTVIADGSTYQLVTGAERKAEAPRWAAALVVGIHAPCAIRTKTRSTFTVHFWLHFCYRPHVAHHNVE
jgi:hypothetical protein